MLTSTIMVYLFTLTSALYIIHLGFYLIGASLYDVWQYRRQNRKSHLLEVIYHPEVTLLIPAHNEELVIRRCLDSVFASTYQYLNVIVVNDASTDATRKLLSQYAKEHPDYALRLIHKRVNVGKGAALNYALRRYVKSELVMMLDADSVLSSNSLERAVSYFINPTISGVAANVQIMNQHTTLSILQKFEHMVSYRSKKAYSLANCDFVIGGVASTYRMSVIRSVGFYDTDTLTEDISLSMKIVAKGNRTHRIIYGSDVTASTEPVENIRALFRQRFRWKYGCLQNILKHRNLIGSSDPLYKPMLTIYRLPMAVATEVALLLLPFIWVYVAYLTISQKNLLLVLGAYLTISLYVFVTLWLDDHLRFGERLYLSLYVPVAYFIFYIMDGIQVIAAAKCLVKSRNLRHHSDKDSTWVSPVRIGGSLTQQPIPQPIPAMDEAHE